MPTYRACEPRLRSTISSLLHRVADFCRDHAARGSTSDSSPSCRMVLLNKAVKGSNAVWSQKATQSIQRHLADLGLTELGSRLGHCTLLNSAGGSPPRRDTLSGTSKVLSCRGYLAAIAPSRSMSSRTSSDPRGEPGADCIERPDVCLRLDRKHRGRKGGNGPETREQHGPRACLTPQISCLGLLVRGAE